MFGDCHIHMLMNGNSYKEAVSLHKNGPVLSDIREKFQSYQASGITFLRDGGDHLGVSEAAAEIAAEYGIDYRTPVFAIHKKGHYGRIVGRSYSDLREYRSLIQEVRQRKGDFIKIMISGIMNFDQSGTLSEPSLDAAEIKELIHIAHEEGYAVMAHTNGADAMRAAALAGVDSIEHGNFPDEETLHVMAEQQTIWVPTFVTITNLIGCGRFPDEGLAELKKCQGEMIRKGFSLGIPIGLGSDAGAYMVDHAAGTEAEYLMFQRLLGIENGNTDWLDQRLAGTEAEIKRRFRPDKRNGG